jgi:hypothetical protein
MVPAEPPDAQAAYAVKRALVDLQIAELERALKAHEARRPLDWQRVRDLELVEERLAQLSRFLATG